MRWGFFVCLKVGGKHMFSPEVLGNNDMSARAWEELTLKSVKDHMLGEGCYQSQCGILASNLRGIENQNLASSGFGFHLLVYAWDGCLGWVKSQIR
ncbi:hypothetical protein BKD74_09405 [Corynebacterium diphtheriae]|nr:hypothetical protein BKD74_09405 [Corynebacterium diphtheriae]